MMHERNINKGEAPIKQSDVNKTENDPQHFKREDSCQPGKEKKIINETLVNDSIKENTQRNGFSGEHVGSQDGQQENKQDSIPKTKKPLEMRKKGQRKVKREEVTEKEVAQAKKAFDNLMKRSKSLKHDQKRSCGSCDADVPKGVCSKKQKEDKENRGKMSQ
jgi:hypothetical protein